MLITTDLIFIDIEENGIMIVDIRGRAATQLNLQEVISLRNFLTDQINKVQAPIALSLKGNANVSRT